jgi:hypothetical protein
MAIVEVKRVAPVAGAAAPAPPAAPATPGAPPVAVAVPALEAAVEAGKTGKPLTRPELGYLAIVLVAVVVGAVVGIVLDDGKRVYSPPDGVSIFALFYIAAQAIERLLEPLSSFYGRTKASAEAGAALPAAATANARYTKSEAVKERDKALAFNDATTAAADAAWWQEMVDQIRRNTTTLWAVASMLGMIAAGWLGLLLLHAVKAPNAPRWLDIILTGIVIGGGTKPLHDLIGNIQNAKEKKENPKEVSGQSAT